MTAESLKPFLSPPSALGTVLTGGGDCRDRKTVAKNVLTIGGSVILFVLFASVIGLEVGFGPAFFFVGEVRCNGLMHFWDW